jgi:hypothetical protein
MAMAAGADLWHMNWSSQHYGFFYKNFPVGMRLGAIAEPSYIVVDQYGKRYFNEKGPNEFVDYTSSIKMDPAVLANSVATFNENAQQHQDPEFSRRVLAPIERGPFYATEVWPCGPNTQGGPRFDSKGRVLDVCRNPIPRLAGVESRSAQIGYVRPDVQRD